MAAKTSIAMPSGTMIGGTIQSLNMNGLRSDIYVGARSPCWKRRRSIMARSFRWRKAGAQSAISSPISANGRAVIGSALLIKQQQAL